MKPGYWATIDDRHLQIRKMSSPHLVNAIGVLKKRIGEKYARARDVLISSNDAGETVRHIAIGDALACKKRELTDELLRRIQS